MEIALILVKLDGQQLKRAIYYRSRLVQLPFRAEQYAYLEEIDLLLDGFIQTSLFKKPEDLFLAIHNEINPYFAEIPDESPVDLDRYLKNIGWTIMNSIELGKFRNQLGLRKCDMVRLLNVSRSTYWHWENGVHDIPRIGVTALKLLALAKSHGILDRWVKQLALTKSDQPEDDQASRFCGF